MVYISGQFLAKMYHNSLLFKHACLITIYLILKITFKIYQKQTHDIPSISGGGEKKKVYSFMSRVGKHHTTNAPE